MSKLHADEVEISGALVRKLLAVQFPDWAALTLTRFPFSGTDHAIYRLGDELAVRLPRIHWAAAQPEKEHRYLPMLAPRLPLAVPVPLALGAPGADYLWNWSVCRWLDGENATRKRRTDLREAADDLAGFICALQQIETADGPPPGAHNSFRGVRLACRDAQTRAAINSLRGVLDPETLSAATAAWETALRAPEWAEPPVWIHGDLQPGNMLCINGQLSGVIDFGCLGVGDPACDLQPAWNLFSGKSRAVFRARLAADDAIWARGRGWALSVALIQLPYYQHTHPRMAAGARRVLREVLADARRESG